MLLRKVSLALVAASLFSTIAAGRAHGQQRHNVIIFVADGLRRGSVTPETMPTFYKLRTAGVDFHNSHAVFPTFTTANASAIATGHGLGDTGDFSNVIYPGVWLTRPDGTEPGGFLLPFLEADDVLANINSVYTGNYLGERTLLSYAREKGFNVASVGKLGPTAIQQIEAVQYDSLGVLNSGEAIVLDDSTGKATGLRLQPEMRLALEEAGLASEAPQRTNGFGDSSPWSNGFQGDSLTPGTRDANRVQEQWFTDATTKVVLPRFASEKKPFVLLFWSRDPDGTQHNQGDSLQQLAPGINGETSKLALKNADRCLKQLLDWLDANPAIKANTDVVVTSDHGFATVSRREIDGKTDTNEVSSALDYELSGKEKLQRKGTLPTGFLAVDLAVRAHLRLFDAAVRASTGDSVYAELTVGGEHSQHPSGGNALLGEKVTRVDGSDARLILAANGGSDLIYVPSHDPAIVRETLATLSRLDYVGGLFVDDVYCPAASDCPGALPLSAIGLVGASKLPRPAIVVTFKVFQQKAGDLQSAAQVSDTSLQEGQGMHGGFGRDQTYNNMAAIGPDFKAGLVDEAPAGNIDLAPTLAHILGFELPSTGKLKGRVLTEALVKEAAGDRVGEKTVASAATSNGMRTLMEFQEKDGVRYLDQACFVGVGVVRCP